MYSFNWIMNLKEFGRIQDEKKNLIPIRQWCEDKMKRGTVFFLTWTTINILFADAYGKVIFFS